MHVFVGDIEDTVGKFCFHFSRVLGSIVDYVIFIIWLVFVGDITRALIG